MKKQISGSTFLFILLHILFLILVLTATLTESRVANIREGIDVATLNVKLNVGEGLRVMSIAREEPRIFMCYDDIMIRLTGTTIFLPQTLEIEDPDVRALKMREHHEWVDGAIEDQIRLALTDYDCRKTKKFNLNITKRASVGYTRPTIQSCTALLMSSKERNSIFMFLNILERVTYVPLNLSVRKEVGLITNSLLLSFSNFTRSDAYMQPRNTQRNVATLVFPEQNECSPFPVGINVAHRLLFVEGMTFPLTTRSIAASVVLTICSHVGLWTIIGWKEFSDTLQQYVKYFSEWKNQQLLGGFWDLVEMGYLEVVIYNNSQYIILDPSLTKILCAPGTQIKEMERILK